jgi:carbonic anhydrase
MSIDIAKLIMKNRKWANNINLSDEKLFKSTETKQNPRYLWIGCSDSRVPETSLLGLPPGHVFTHRNIANQIHANDNSMLSVVDFAVNYLGIKEVIVCGHYNCGGVSAALNSDRLKDPLSSWLSNISKSYLNHAMILQRYNSNEDRFKAACRLNVIEQVINLSQLQLIKKLWSSQIECNIHGLIYDVSCGHLNDLDITINGDEALEELKENIESRVLG